MAAFLSKMIPTLTKAVVTEEVPASQRRAPSSSARRSRPAKSRAKPAKSRAASRSSKPAKSRSSKPAKSRATSRAAKPAPGTRQADMPAELQRYELKYTIPRWQVDEIEAFIAPYCFMDAYSARCEDGFYRVNSLYLDSPELILLRTRLCGAQQG